MAHLMGSSPMYLDGRNTRVTLWGTTWGQQRVKSTTWGQQQLKSTTNQPLGCSAADRWVTPSHAPDQGPDDGDDDVVGAADDGGTVQSLGVGLGCDAGEGKHLVATAVAAEFAVVHDVCGLHIAVKAQGSNEQSSNLRVTRSPSYTILFAMLAIWTPCRKQAKLPDMHAVV